MELIEIVVITYLILSGTLGAFYLAKTDPRLKGHDITLFDVMGHQLVAVLFIVPLLIIDLCINTVVLKRNSKNKQDDNK